jgi:hypothetical protein
MKTPTAKEFLSEKIKLKSKTFIDEDMIEFAKLKCQEQLESILKNAKVNLAKDWIRKEETIHPNSLVSSITIKVDEQSILNAYPLDNIK